MGPLLGRGGAGASMRLALILVSAFAVRAAYLMLYRASPLFGYYRNDQLYYRAWGLEIAGGDWLGSGVFGQGPLYAYLLGPVFRLFGPRETPVLVLQLLCGVATALLAWWCAGRVFGPRAGTIAGTLAAVYGPFVFYESMVMKTFLEPLLALAALAAGLRGISGGAVRWFAGAGAAVGLASLVRESHALLLVPLLPAALCAQPGPHVARRLRLPAAVLASFLLVLAPSAFRNAVVAHEPVAVSAAGGQNLYIGFGPFATGSYALPDFASSIPFQEHDDFLEEASLRTGRRLSRAESSRYWLAETLRVARQAPARIFDLLAVKAGILFNDYEVPDNENFGAARELIPLLRVLPTFGWIAAAGLLGAGVALRRGGPAALTAGFAAALILEVLLTFSLGRYRAGLAGPWLVLAGGWLDGVLFAPLEGRAALARRAASIAIAIVLTALAFRCPPRIDRAEIARAQAKFLEEVRLGAAFAARIPALREASAARPGDAAALADLGLAFEVSGRLPEALTTYEGVLRLSPEASPVRFKLADILARTGHLGRAEEHARTLASRLPDDAAAHALLGTVLTRQGMHADADSSAARFLDAADDALRRAVLLRPGDAELRVLHARALAASGRTGAALRELAAARDLAPGLRSVDTLARILHDRGGT